MNHVGASSAREAFKSSAVREPGSLLRILWPAGKTLPVQASSCRRQFAAAHRGYRRRGANDWLLLATMLGCLLLSLPTQAERLKDLASIQGVRSNQLIGYGLVVGLNGTGDQTTQTPFTVQTFNNMLAQFGIKVPPGGNVQLKNVAAVSVHADLPAFAKPGQTIDITISSIGNAKSLRGGSLLMTPLKGIDGNVYAIAQGNLVVGGFDASGADGSRITVNVPSAGRIPGGATVERPVPSGFDQGNYLTLNLNRPDFTTAKNIVDQINDLLGPGVAQAIDGGSIRVSAPTICRSSRTCRSRLVKRWPRSSSTRAPAPSSSARTSRYSRLQ